MAKEAKALTSKKRKKKAAALAKVCIGGEELEIPLKCP